jgi:hemolysin D
MHKRSAELEFLPAALEIEHTPPLAVSRWILWVIIAFFTIAVAWSCIGKINIVGVARGKIVPSGRVKVVQAVATGVVKAIHIREGDRIAAGDLLIELDDTKARADLEGLNGDHHALVWDRYRLRALLGHLDHAGSGQSLTSGSPEPAAGGRVPALVKARIRNEYAAYTAKRGAIDEDINRNRAERLTIERRIAQLDAIIPLVTERVAALEKLEKKSLAPRTKWLELEEERVEKVTEREVLRARLAVFDASQSKLGERRAVLLAETETEWLTELADVQKRIASRRQEIRKARRRLHEHRLAASVAGTVQQLAINTVGGVVTPAEKLMLIVPDEAALHVEARVLNKDIGFVHNGQGTEIKLDTFPFTKYGSIDGELENVSSDAIADEKLGLVYLAQIRMARTTIWVRDKLVDLSPGMAVTVEFDIGERRLIEFLLTPLIRYKGEGLKER